MRRDDAALQEQDTAARIAAQTVFDRSIVLEAGAGTGKTTALVARTVAWCLGPGWEKAETALRIADEVKPSADRVATRVASRVLAITYTEAAAAEMASRIARVISELAAGVEPSEKLREDGLPSPDLRRSRAAALVGAIDRINVRTIHGFCHRLLSIYPLEAGLHPSFRIDADNSEVGALAHRLVESAWRDALGNGDEPGWTALARDGVGPADVSRALAALLEVGVSGDVLAQPAYDATTIEAVLAPLRAAAEAAVAPFAAFASVKGSGNAKLVGPALDQTRALLAGDRPSDASTFAAFVQALDGLWGVSETPRLLDKLRDWVEKGKWSKAEATALGTDVDAVLRAARPLCAALEDVVHLEPERFERARLVLAPLLQEAASELRRFGIVTFDALLRQARDLVVGRADVAERVRAGVDLLLIDEFQDTDPVQCDLVRALALDPAAKESPSLFLVGDPKQSIFGWRNADLAAYQEMLDRVEASGGERFRLCINHRSVQPVLDEVERVTEPLLQHKAGEQAEFQRLLASRNPAQHPGFAADGRAPIEHWLSCELDEDRQGRTSSVRDAVRLEANAIAREIEWLHRVHGVAWKDVALLFRSTGDVEHYLIELRRRDVPYEIAKDRTYYQRREVVEAAALVRCVLDPNDALALVSWLRSVSGGVPDAAWLPLWRRGFPDLMAQLRGPDAVILPKLTTMLREVGAGLKPAELPRLEQVADWPEAAACAVATIARLRESFGTEPVDVFVDQLRVLGGQERLEAGRYLARHRLANLDRFFRELLEHLASGAEPSAALRVLRQGASPSREAGEGTPGEAASDAVRVLTMHGAKGLQFGHVYCVQLHKGRSGNRNQKPAETGEHGGRRVWSLLGTQGPGFAAFARARTRRADQEAKRLLYVAMTRAQDRIVLAGLWRELCQRSNTTALSECLEPRLAKAAAAEHLRAAMAEDPASDRFVYDEATWVIPARAASEPPRRAEARSESRFDLASVRRDVEQLTTKRSEAHRLRDLPRLVTASSLSVGGSPGTAGLQIDGAASHELGAEARESDEPCSDGDAIASRGAIDLIDFAGRVSRADTDARSESGPEPTARYARAIGTAVHRALEVMSFDSVASSDAERTRLAAVIDATLEGLMPARDAHARARALELLDRALAPGGLLDALRARASEIVARELPVLLSREEPPGVVVGTIDLLYRERESGRLVVADWKTDRLTAEAAIARAEHYRAQATVYVGAARRALGESVAPRFELFFLDPGEIVTLTLDG